MTALLLGGEMPHWSDHFPVRGAVLRELLRTVHGDTLIVGPHDPALIDRPHDPAPFDGSHGSPLTGGPHGPAPSDTAPDRQVTVLVRGVPDADELAARYADRPDVRICCGSLDKLAAVPAYDTVIALDGLDRTGSSETAGLSWSAGIARLLAVLRPGGRIILGHTNPLGLHRLYAGATTADDAAWTTPAGTDTTSPAGLEPLRAHLRAAGLTVMRDYAAYPSPQAPTVLLSETALADPDLHGVLTSALRRAGLPDGPMLADPRPLAAGLLRHDLATALAPAWIVVAGGPGHTPLPLPEALLTAPRTSLSSSPATVTAPATTTATAATTTAAATAAISAGSDSPVIHLQRTDRGWILGPAGGPVPVGRCLHDALLTAAGSSDQPELRALLTTWQSSDVAGIPADQIIISAGGRLHPLTTAAAPDDRADVLQQFATALHHEGLAHLWPAEGTTELLATMAGIEIGPIVVAPTTPETLRELAAAHDRLQQDLSDTRAQIAWYETRTATLQAQLSRAHRIIAVLKGTPSGRAATAVLAGARTGKRLARAALGRLRP